MNFLVKIMLSQETKGRRWPVKLIITWTAIPSVSSYLSGDGGIILKSKKLSSKIQQTLKQEDTETVTNEQEKKLSQ